MWHILYRGVPSSMTHLNHRGILPPWSKNTTNLFQKFQNSDDPFNIPKHISSQRVNDSNLGRTKIKSLKSLDLKMENLLYLVWINFLDPFKHASSSSKCVKNLMGFYNMSPFDTFIPELNYLRWDTRKTEIM